MEVLRIALHSIISSLLDFALSVLPRGTIMEPAATGPRTHEGAGGVLGGTLLAIWHMLARGFHELSI